MVVRTRVVGPERGSWMWLGPGDFWISGTWGGALKEWVLPDMTQRERERLEEN